MLSRIINFQIIRPMNESFKITKNQETIKKVCEIYYHTQDWLLSYRLIGMPGIFAKGTYPGLTDAGWLWPIEVVDCKNTKISGYFYYNELNECASFCITDIANWNRKKYPLRLTFRNQKIVSFYLENSIQTEIEYKGTNGRCPDTAGIRELFVRGIAKRNASVINTARFAEKVTDIRPVLFKRHPAFTALVDNKQRFLMYASPLGYDFVENPSTLIELTDSDTKHISEPKIGKSYLMSPTTLATARNTIMVCMFPLCYDGSTFKYIPFEDADFDL